MQTCKLETSSAPRAPPWPPPRSAPPLPHLFHNLWNLITSNYNPNPNSQHHNITTSEERSQHAQHGETLTRDNAQHKITLACTTQYNANTENESKDEVREWEEGEVRSGEWAWRRDCGRGDPSHGHRPFGPNSWLLPIRSGHARVSGPIPSGEGLVSGFLFF